MSNAHVRLPEDWRRFDRVGLAGALLLPALLALLWFTGLGPTAYQACDLKPGQYAARLADGRVTLSGRVADSAERKTLVDAAIAAFGADKVTDRITVDGGTQAAPWVRNAQPMMRRLKQTGARGALTIDDRRAAIEGEATDEAAKAAVVRELQSLFGKDLALADSLTVRAAPLPAPAAVPAPAPVSAPVAAAPPATVPTGGQSVVRLPDGTDISIVGNGLEAKLLGFLSDGSRQIDRGLWFDFDRLNFRTGSADLTPESRRQIEAVAAILKAYPNVAIKIGGYTDNVGDPNANLTLSAARAARVMQEVVGLGIAAERVEAEGYGEQHPIADNATADGRALNRRTALSVRRK